MSPYGHTEAVPESPRSPRALYPAWPHDEHVTNPAHEVVQRFARAVERLTLQTSTSDVARKSNVPVATVSSVVRGAALPSALTLAKLEHGTGAHLWRVREKKLRIPPQ